jgi:plasmid maintenance system antidote protein VapI
MMSNVELQRQMLRFKMSINDMAMCLHVTKDQVKRFVNGKEEIPEWVQLYFGALNDGSKKGPTRQS